MVDHNPVYLAECEDGEFRDFPCGLWKSVRTPGVPIPSSWNGGHAVGTWEEGGKPWRLTSATVISAARKATCAG